MSLYEFLKIIFRSLNNWKFKKIQEAENEYHENEHYEARPVEVPNYYYMSKLISCPFWEKKAMESSQS